MNIPDTELVKLDQEHYDALFDGDCLDFEVLNTEMTDYVGTLRRLNHHTAAVLARQLGGEQSMTIDEVIDMLDAIHPGCGDEGDED